MLQTQVGRLGCSPTSALVADELSVGVIARQVAGRVGQRVGVLLDAWMERSAGAWVDDSLLMWNGCVVVVYA